MGQKLTKKYSKVTNLFYLKTINIFNVYFVYNFYNFKYLINKRQQSAVIICAIRTTRIKLIKSILLYDKKFQISSEKTFTLIHIFDSEKDSPKNIF